MNQSTEKQTHAPSHSSRRLKYGVNVAIAAVVAVAIALLINWIAYRQNARFDFTVTGEYTLSPQTQAVLDQLEGDVEIATVFPLDNEQLNRVHDLTEEYARSSDQVSATHIDPSSNADAFYQRITERFSPINEPLKSEIETAQQVLLEAQGELKTLLEPLTQASSAGDKNLKDRLLEVWTVLSQVDKKITADREDIQAALDSPLPDLGGAKRTLVALMQDQLEAGLLGDIETFFKQLIDLPSTPDDVKNTLLELNEKLAPMREKLRAAHEALARVESSPQYDQLRATLASTPSVVVFQGESVQVIPVVAMFPDQSLMQQAETKHDARFLGEEKLTGAIVSLSMEQAPLIVFVTDGSIPALGQNGQFNYVAQRLAATGFDVRQWNPQGQMTRDGRMAPPAPMPTVTPGQKAVWVFLPTAPPDPQNPMAMGSGEAIAGVLKQRAEAGDGVMVMLMANPGSRFGAANPVADSLGDWGVTAQLDRVVVDQQHLPDQRTQSTTRFDLTDWPSELSVTRAIAGMRGYFVQSCPLVFGGEDVTHYPLVTLTGQKLWAERDFAGLRDMSDADYDAAEAADSFTVGVACEKENGRLIAVADPAWAMDQITSLGQLGPYSAELTGAIFPGNSELFVNSVLWLAELDELIAASPRSQDMPRIGAMEQGQLKNYQWTLGAGLPAAVLVIGLAVWFVRRRG